MMRSDGFRTDINGLRGLSVAMVVAYHLQLKGSGGGFIGVDVFFVISGYLMTRIVWRDMAAGCFSYWRFIAARVARIWPALAAMLVVLFLLGSMLLAPLDMRALAKQAAWAMPMLSNLYFLEHSGYNTDRADDLWLLHTWSLSIEWQFYMLYPLLLIAAAALYRKWARVRSGSGAAVCVMVVVLGASALSLGYQWLLRSVEPDASFFLAQARIWELLAGGLVFLAARDSRAVSARSRVAAAYAGLALVLLSALAIALLRQRPVGLGPVLLIPVIGVALILWADDKRNAILGNSWLQCLGRWSYSVYLWHWPVIVALRLTAWPAEFPILTALSATAASVLFGWLSYRYVERLALKSRADLPWQALKRPAMMMVLAIGATVAVASTDGLAWRARESDQFYASYQTSIRPLLFPEACSNFQKSVAEFKICPIERGGGSPRVLVIGDSHAEHLWPWFVKHSQVAVDFFPASECPPVPRFTRMQPGYHCQDYAELAWRKALSPAYGTVIVSARWATVGMQGPPYCHQAAGAPCVSVSGSKKQALALTELRDAIEGVLQAGKRVVVLASAPESPFRVPARLAREAFWYGQARLVTDAHVSHAQTLWTEELFMSLKARPAFHLVSVRDRLCDVSACRVYDNTLRRPVYIDESHFDPLWIAENGAFFAPFVRAR